MDMVTVKRDGVFISFSEFERKNGDVRDDVILGARVNKSINSCKRRNVPSKKKTAQKPKSVIKVNTGKRCMRCGKACTDET
ncbi:MAG: hypothetical protein K1W39_03775 [Lachnospiraceae bacterium]|jgi:hypothetical protein